MTSLQDYLRAPARDEVFVSECEQAAQTMVDELLKGRVIDEGLKPLRSQAILTAGANLYARRARLTEGGATTYDGTVQFSPDRPTRDPLDAARHVLAPVLGPGFA